MSAQLIEAGASRAARRLLGITIFCVKGVGRSRPKLVWVPTQETAFELLNPVSARGLANSFSERARCDSRQMMEGSCKVSLAGQASG
jgi:hypothetical protein